MSWVAELLSMLWRFFSQTQVPILEISFAAFYIGIFVVGFSTVIIRHLLGIGGSVVHHVGRSARSARSARSSDNSDG